MSGERILLVEDDPDQRRLVSGLLAAEGYAVAEVATQPAAEAELQRAIPAVLRELGATAEFKGTPDWPVLGPPQGIEADIWPVGESSVHAPFYTHGSN